jgi:hypothetical protein
MPCFEKIIDLPVIMFSDHNKQIILSKDRKKYIASKKTNELWVLVKESTSYNVCYNALFPRK